MIEIILVLGLLFILSVVGILHVLSTCKDTFVHHIFSVENMETDSSLNYLYTTFELILIFSILYIIRAAILF